MSQNINPADPDPQAVDASEPEPAAAPATLDDMRAELAGLNNRLYYITQLVEQNATRPAPVRVVDFNMTVGAIIALLFKYLIASLIVGIVVFIIGAVVAMVLVALGLYRTVSPYVR